MLVPSHERNTYRIPQTAREDGLEKVTIDYFQEFEDVIQTMKNVRHCINQCVYSCRFRVFVL